MLCEGLTRSLASFPLLLYYSTVNQPYRLVRACMLEGPLAPGELAARLGALGPVLVVLEGTGGLEWLAAGVLATAGLPMILVTPRQARDFARDRAPGTDGSERRGCAGPF